MAESPRPLSRAEREAHRAVLEDALRDLAGGKEPERAAGEVVRALDAYIEAHSGGTALAPRETPVTDFARTAPDEARRVAWFVVGGAVVATCIVALLLPGGWPAAAAVIAIWVLAVAALRSS